MKATLLAVDVLSADATSNQPRIAALLRDAARAAENVAASNPAAAEYQYRRLQLAQKSGDQETVNSAAQWIATNGSGSPYELPALVITARAADAAVESASDADRAARQQEAARVYARLVELLGDSPTVLAASKNALAASSKLAQYDEALGRWPQAADRLQRLVEALPSDRRFLRRAGLATFQSGRHADSLEHWRKLLAGLSSGSDEWLEAKYYQLACLLKTDRAPAADKVWKQFKLLFPEVKSRRLEGQVRRVGATELRLERCPPSPPLPLPSIPPLLAEFRQQGGAIVAQERGLTATCRVKLTRLAENARHSEQSDRRRDPRSPRRRARGPAQSARRKIPQAAPQRSGRQDPDDHRPDDRSRDPRRRRPQVQPG